MGYERDARMGTGPGIRNSRDQWDGSVLPCVQLAGGHDESRVMSRCEVFGSRDMFSTFPLRGACVGQRSEPVSPCR